MLKSTIHFIHGIYIRQYYLALVHLIPSQLVWAEIKCMLHVDLSKWPMKQLKPVQQSRQQALKVYCSNIYTI